MQMLQGTTDSCNWSHEALDTGETFDSHDLLALSQSQAADCAQHHVGLVQEWFWHYLSILGHTEAQRQSAGYFDTNAVEEFIGCDLNCGLSVIW